MFFSYLNSLTSKLAKKSILFIPLLFLYFNVSAQDSVQFCKIIPASKSFIAVANDFKTIRRHQLYSFNLLTRYDVADKNLIAVIADEKNAKLYGISQSQLIHFDLISGKVTHTYNLANSITNLLIANLYVLKDKQLASFNPESGKIAICTGVDLFMIEAATGNLLSEHHVSSIPECFYLVDNGTTILYTQSLSESIWKINTKNGEQIELFKFANLAHFSLNKTQNQAIAVTQNAYYSETEIVYFNLQGDKLKKVKTTKLLNPRFMAKSTALFYNSSMVINAFGYTYLNYYNAENGSTQSLNFEMQIAGFDQMEYQFIIWNAQEIKQFDSRGLLVAVLPKLGSFSNDFSPYTRNKEAQMFEIDTGITAITEYNDNLIIGDNKGNLHYNQNTYNVIYTPITALTAKNKEQIMVGGLGRCVDYSVSSGDAKRVYRGIDGAITHIVFSKNQEYLALFNQVGKLYLFETNGALVCTREGLDAVQNAKFIDTKHIRVQYPNQLWDTINISSDIDEFENKERQLLINSLHLKAVQNISFSKNGKQLLTSDLEGIIKLWDVQSLVVTQSNFLSDISHAIFSPDNQEILAYGLYTFYLLDAITLKVKREFPIPPYFKNQMMIGDVAFINENVAAFSELRYGSIFNLNINSGDFFYAYSFPKSNGIYAIASDVNNKRLATFGEDSIHILSTENFSQLNATAHPNKSWKNIYVKRLLNFSPEHTKLLAEQDDDIVVYSFPDLRPLKVFNKAQQAHFLNEEEVLVFTDVNKYEGRFELAKYNLASDEKKPVYTTPKYNSKNDLHISQMASISNELIALQYSNGSIELFNAKTLQSIRKSNISIESSLMSFNPKDGKLAIAAPNRTDIYDWKEVSKKRVIQHNFNIKTMKSNFRYSPNGSYYLKIYSKYIEVFDNIGTQLLHKLRGEFGDKIVLNETDKWMLIWDMESLFKYNLETGILEWEKKWDTKVEFVDNVLVNRHDEIVVVTRKYITDIEIYEQTKKKHSFHLTKYNNEGTKRLAFEIDATALGASVLLDKTLIFENSWGSIALLNITSQEMETIDELDQIDNIYLVPNSKNVLISNDKGEIRIVSTTSKKITPLPKKHSGQIKTIDFYENYMLTSSKEGNTILWDKTKLEPFLYFVGLTNDAYAFYTDSLYYVGTPSISKSLFFKQNNEVYPFEQFDLIYNRPDKIIAKVSDNIELVKLYNSAYNKRLLNLGINPETQYNSLDMPTAKWIKPPEYPETQEANLRLEFEANATKNTLQKVHIWINNVPLYGAGGKLIQGKSYSNSVVIQLSSGSNKIELSVTDSRGLESLRQSFLITYNPISPISRTLHLVVLAVSDYDGKEHDLKYAVKDGRDMVESFNENHKNFDAIEIDSLFDQNVTIENLSDIKSKLKNSKVDDAVLVFVAGHGLLDTAYNFYYATPQCNFKQPHKGGISYTTIEGLLDYIPARKKLLLMDACHSGQVDKSLSKNQQLGNSAIKEGSRGVIVNDDASSISFSNSFELMGELFLNLERGSGTQVISAATGDGSALERDDWNNGAFTYTILNGLRGMKCDTNEDDKISITELRNYVIPEVERLTNGLQKPTIRQENIEFDWTIW